MIKLKNKKEISNINFSICLVKDCQEESTKIWATESNVIDVCDEHHNILKEERYK